jgi:DNA-binding response OmpR family regulator
MRLIIKLAMEQAGFETTAVSTIKEAEQKLHEMSFAVMTLDLNLPDGDGLAFLKQLRNRAATSRMPVVVVSARAAEARRTFVGDSSSVDWLVKPLDQQMLVQSVRGALLRGESQLRLLYVGAENTTGNDLIQALNGLARVVLARDLTNCYQELRARHFDLLVVDPSLPKPAVKELLDHVRSGADDMPRVVVLAESELNLSERVRALALAE